MHGMHDHSKVGDGPETSGRVLHQAAPYDFFTSLAGMGVNGRNSSMVVELAKIQPGQSVLDIGCGSGNLTLTAAAQAGPGARVHGVDASPEMIGVARRKASRAGSSVHFDVGLIEKLPFPDAEFDIVITRLAVHHLPDDLKRQGFAEVFRVLKRGGRFLIADFTPPRNPALHVLTAALMGSHMMHSDIWALPTLLAAAGFSDIACGPTRSIFLGFVSSRKPDG
jgi:ubiquinone/menaquinone biosynthesis C-methylase UbiE